MVMVEPRFHVHDMSNSAIVNGNSLPTPKLGFSPLVLDRHSSDCDCDCDCGNVVLGDPGVVHYNPILDSLGHVKRKEAIATGSFASDHARLLHTPHPKLPR